MRARSVEIEVPERAERLHVELAAIAQAVEASRHEVARAALLQQPALGDLDAGIGGHERIGVLDDGIALGSSSSLSLLALTPSSLSSQ